MQSRILGCALALSLALSVGSSANGVVIYVNAAAPSGGDGTSWESPYNNLQDALATAMPESGDQLWVVAGIYTPAEPSGDRLISFNLASGTAIYGGFVGRETSLDQRDPVKNITILSADLNGDDVGNAVDPSHAENSYHVVRATNTSFSTRLDGLTITGGRADGNTANRHGGGVFLTDADLQIENCTIVGNGSVVAGGGVYLFSTSYLIINESRIQRNYAIPGPGNGDGAGLYSLSSNVFISDSDVSENVGALGSVGQGVGIVFWNSIMDITGCTFVGNHGRQAVVETVSSAGFITNSAFIGNTLDFGGGALLIFGSGPVRDCQFIGNHGGGMLVSIFGNTSATNCSFFGNDFSAGGGFHLQTGNASLVNCVFGGNSAEQTGGAIHIADGDLQLTNCTIARNTAQQLGGGIYRVAPTSDLNLLNTIVWDNTDVNGGGELSQISGGVTSIAYSCVQGWSGIFGGTTNLGGNPQFVDADGPDNVIGTEDDNLRLSALSPCVNRTNPSASPPYPVDIDGLPRLQECIVDLGAYELPDANPLLPDCDNSGGQDPCDIAAHFSQDCNLNVIPDHCDIASGFSADLDANNIPDSCQGVPANNGCGGATVVQSGAHFFTTVNATTDGPTEPLGCNFVPDGQIYNDVWFRYPAQCAGIVTISLCGVTYDARLAVYVGCPSQPGQMIACSDNECGTAPRVSFANAAVTIYRVRVGGAAGAVGGGTMILSCTPSPVCTGDANGDGTVNISDLLLVIASWGQAGLSPADINGDNMVDINDLLGVIAAWGACP